MTVVLPDPCPDDCNAHVNQTLDEATELLDSWQCQRAVDLLRSLLEVTALTRDRKSGPYVSVCVVW
jgi:hypothetical protein